MKRILCLCLVLLMIACGALAEENDLSLLTREELLSLRDRIDRELESRPAADDDTLLRIRTLAEAACTDAGYEFSGDWTDCDCLLEWSLCALNAYVYTQNGIVFSPHALRAEALLEESGDRLIFLSLDEEVLLDDRVSIGDERILSLLGLTDENGDSVLEKKVRYVCNNGRMKFHLPSCPSVQDMKSTNREDVTLTRDELIAMGYQPCQRCNP